MCAQCVWIFSLFCLLLFILRLANSCIPMVAVPSVSHCYLGSRGLKSLGTLGIDYGEHTAQKYKLGFMLSFIQRFFLTQGVLKKKLVIEACLKACVWLESNERLFCFLFSFVCLSQNKGVNNNRNKIPNDHKNTLLPALTTSQTVFYTSIHVPDFTIPCEI